MRRIAFLRSIEIQQAAPYLEPLRAAFAERDAEGILFYTHGDVGCADWPGAAERLPLSATAGEVTRQLLSWGVDGVISLSIPDENSLRDALVKQELAAHGIPAVMHSVDATSCMSNKWATKELVRMHGLHTPVGLLMDGDLLNGRCLAVPAYAEVLTQQAHRLGFPLLSKPLWDCLGNGIRLIDNAASWERFLADPFEGNAILERCITGELCSVEIVGQDGMYAVQPLIWKGPTGGAPGFAFTQVRYAAPREVPDQDFAPVSERLVELCRGLQIDGAIEVEMIYHDRTYSIIEINPRVSGSTSMSIAASGFNTYLGLFGMLFGDWPPRPAADCWGQHLTARRRLAFQIPLATLSPHVLNLAHRDLTIVRASNFTVDEVTYANMLITCEYAETAATARALTELTLRHGLLEPEVHAELAELLARVTDEMTYLSAADSDKELYPI
jgi:biotin carboxylase